MFLQIKSKLLILNVYIISNLFYICISSRVSNTNVFTTTLCGFRGYIRTQYRLFFVHLESVATVHFAKLPRIRRCRRKMEEGIRESRYLEVHFYLTPTILYIRGMQLVRVHSNVLPTVFKEVIQCVHVQTFDFTKKCIKNNN